MSLVVCVVWRCRRGQISQARVARRLLAQGQDPLSWSTAGPREKETIKLATLREGHTFGEVRLWLWRAPWRLPPFPASRHPPASDEP